jgi:hypothetical protein
MKLQALSGEKSIQKMILTFKGYNHNLSIGDGEFYDMQNLSSRLYPLLSTRLPRGTVKSFIQPNGLADKNVLVYVDGTNFYYNDVVRGTVTNGPKQLISMGTYILIFPDKKFYNISTGEYGSLENHISMAGAISISGCTQDGVSADAATSLYTKISATGIGMGFKQYDGVTISGCTVSSLNGVKIIYYVTNDYIVIAGKIGVATSQSGGLTIDRNVPDMDFLTENNNRIWGCSSAKHEIYSSKLGDPFNWNCYEGISTDSYAATIGSDGDFTGAITYLGYALFFKEECVHKVYGSKPSNYQVIENTIPGVAKSCHKSLSIINGTLYYMSRSGVMAYEGGLPERISYAFGDKTYTDGVAGAYGDKYYISVKEGITYHLFVHDTKLNLWHREDNTQALYFTEYDGKLYYIDGATKILKTVTGNDTDIIYWKAEFSDFTEKTMNQKYVSRLQLRLETENERSIFDVDIQYDGNGVWEKVTSTSGMIRKNYNIPIKIRRCEYYTLRLSGQGQFKLYGIEKTYTEGSGW